VRNLGVIFDSALNMEQQLNNICKAGYHLHEQAIGYISDMLTVYQPRRTLRSVDSVTLVVPFQYSAAKLWNALPAHIRESKTLNIFKMLLKTHLFSRHFDL